MVFYKLSCAWVGTDGPSALSAGGTGKLFDLGEFSILGEPI